MSVIQIVLASILSIGLLYWLAGAILCAMTVRSVRNLSNIHPPVPPVWPKLSLIIPAANEENTIEKAVQTRLSEDYPNLEYILINDRSTDRTGEIIDAFASSDPRVKALHIDELPSGWLGKVYALKKGTETASGEWFLFTDADVHIDPGTLKKAVAWSIDQKLDHLGIFPNLWTGRFFLNVVLSVFVRSFSIMARYHTVSSLNSDSYTGVGAFNLVRREALEKSEGFEWLRLEIGDDVALAMVLKRSGARSSLLNGSKSTRVLWYPRIRDMAVGLERGAYGAIGGYNVHRTIILTVLFLICELSPIIALFPLGLPWLQVAGGVALALSMVTSVMMSLWSNGPVVPPLLWPVGSVIMSYMFIRAGVLGHKRGGIYWRGTLYRSEMLKAGRRLSMP